MCLRRAAAPDPAPSRRHAVRVSHVSSGARAVVTPPRKRLPPACPGRGSLSTQGGTVAGRRHLSMVLSERVSRVHFPSPPRDLKQRNTQPATDCRWRWCYPLQGHWYDATDSAAWRPFIIIASMPMPGQDDDLAAKPSPSVPRDFRGGGEGQAPAQ